MIHPYLTIILQLFFLSQCFYSSNISAQKDDRIKQLFEISSTSVVKHSNKVEMQIISIINNSEYSEYEVKIIFPNKLIIQFDINNEPMAYKEIDIIKSKTEIEAVFLVDDRIIYKDVFLLNPPKTWTIYDIQVSHHDLGYADYYHMMRRDVREMGIEMALDFCRKTDNNSFENKFRWTVETSEPLLPFLQNKPDSVIEEFRQRIKQGRISLGGVHNSASTEHLSYETYARLFYTPNRHVVDWLDIPKSRTALIDDVVGFTKSLPLYSKEAGIEYFFLGRNSTVNEFEHLQEEPAFYWNSQDGDTRKTLFKVFEYYSPDRLTQYNIEEISKFLKKYELKNNWPYNCLMAEDSYDFSLPSLTNIEGIKKWNENFSNPRIISATFDMFFNDLSKQEKLRPFDEFEKDVPNSWSDQDLGDAQYAGKVHNLGYRLPEAEKFSSIAQAYCKGKYPWEEIYQGYNRLLMYAEHTNGAYAEGPIYVPESLKDVSAANATYYEIEQKMHRTLVDEAETFTDRVEKEAFDKLEKMISSSSDNSLVVYNSLNFSRDDIVTFSPPNSLNHLKIIDNSTNEVVPFQLLPSGSVLFIANNIPSVGYKTYSLLNDEDETKNLSILTSKKIIENEYYVIEFDESKGTIKSIYDKELKKELVDQNSKYRFNEYIYQKYETRNYKEGPTEFKSDTAEIKCYNGQLVNIVESKIQAVGCDSIKQIVKLYKGIKRIDFELELIKSHSGRTLELYRQGFPMAKNKEALFYAFPFDVPNFNIRHELPGGSIEPIIDQSAGSSTDYYAIQHYSDISNSEYGITLTLTDPNLIEYGTPRAAPWNEGDAFESILKKPEYSHIFLYLANNTFFTNMRQSQHGKMNFRWSITSHLGNWQEGKVFKSGWSNTHELKPILTNGKRKSILPETEFSFVSTDQDNVICSTIKPAEANGKGYILRFFETAGNRTKVKTNISLDFDIASVVETNLIEDDKNVNLRLINDKSFEFSIEPFGIKTIRVIPVSAELPSIQNITAKSLSDRCIRLKWNISKSKTQNFAYYKVYRSEKSDFMPSLRNYIGSTDKAEFVDKPALNYGGWISYDIHPSTTYFYKVVPISNSNLIGKASNSIEAKTLESLEINSPPNKVEGVYSAHVSDIAPFNYNAIFFYTNIESDVVKYHIHRSLENGFIPNEENFIHEIDAAKSFEHVTPHGFASVVRELREFNRQLFIDQDVEDRKTYFYKICAIDDAGNVGEYSDEVAVKSEIFIIDIKGQGSFSDQTKVKIVPTLSKILDVKYTVDGSAPTIKSKKYTSPFEINKTTTIKTAIFENGKKLSLPTIEKTFYKSNDYNVIYNTPYNKRWASTGNFALVDNAKGNYYTDGFWQGFEFEDMDLIIDLKKTQKVSQIKSTYMNFIASWIFLPQYVEYFVSTDGINYTPVGKIKTKKDLIKSEELIEEYSVKFPSTGIRYIKVVAKNQRICPPWHLSAGGKAWIFIDEIIINN